MEAERRTKVTIEDTPLPGVKIICPKIFPDDRGFFSETYNTEEWSRDLGFNPSFKQDNHSWSKFGVLRGLHVQPDMGKLVSCMHGEVYDVAVDGNPDSPNFGKHFGMYLNDREKKFLWVPAGFFHGFQCISKEGCHVYYKCSATYDGKTEFGADPLDPELGIEWPLLDDIIISDRDRNGPRLKEIENLKERLAVSFRTETTV